jgi:Ca-activated chloride channel family protein
MLIPLLILLFLIASNKDSMQRIFSQKTLDALSMSNQYMKKSTRNVLFFMALILMVLALARPVTNKKEISIKQEVTPIVVAIDVSKSMLANDIFPNRLEMAKNKLKILIENSKHNAVGVLLFAKSAFILSPLTQDFNSLSYLVQHFDNGLNFDNGSNIFALLEASNKLLKNYTNKNILILSDGANKENFEQEINYANKHQLHIYTLGLATTKPTPIKIKEDYLTDKQGNIVTVSLNENIKNLSLETKGAYTAFTLDSQDILALLQEIENQSQKEQMQQKKIQSLYGTVLLSFGRSIIHFIVCFFFTA